MKMMEFKMLLFSLSLPLPFLSLEKKNFSRSPWAVFRGQLG